MEIIYLFSTVSCVVFFARKYLYDAATVIIIMSDPEQTVVQQFYYLTKRSQEYFHGLRYVVIILCNKCAQWISANISQKNLVPLFSTVLWIIYSGMLILLSSHF